MIYNDNKLVIIELAKKYGTSYEVIREVVESPFAFMYEELKKYDMKQDELPLFFIPRFGTFKPKFKFLKVEDGD